MVRTAGPGGSPEDPNRLMIHGLIGSGAYGHVHRGRWRNMDVAVKTVSWKKSRS